MPRPCTPTGARRSVLPRMRRASGADSTLECAAANPTPPTTMRTFMQSIRPSTLLKTASGLAVLAVCAACSQEPAPPAASVLSSSGDGASLETRPRNSANYEPAFAGQTRAPGVKSPFELEVTVVAEGLNSPWAFEFLPDERVLVTE